MSDNAQDYLGQPDSNLPPPPPPPVSTLTPTLSIDDIAAVERLAGLEFSPHERELMLPELQEQLDAYKKLRAVDLPNHLAPALLFRPEVGRPPTADDRPPNTDDRPLTADDRPQAAGTEHQSAAGRLPSAVIGPPSPVRGLDSVAFWSVAELAGLIQSRQVTSSELTEMYLERLKRYDPMLHCVVTLTEDLALEQARRADAEIASGFYRGPLHGIPWGAKDLLAVQGYPTTWGAGPYRDQVLDLDATVVRRLEEAGAVLVAKLTLGELAWGDEWFGGKTRTPWNPEEGSSGSSAGSAAATSAGLVGFSMGSETWGSIVSPSTRCGVSGLRPTFGRVSRYGAMALSWSMDKLGPICRTVEDCALVFAAIHGADVLDPAAVTRPFAWTGRADLYQLRIGYLAQDFEGEYDGKVNDMQTLDLLRKLGANLIPVALPDYPTDALALILNVEAAAAFDELTRTHGVDQLVRQGKESWPAVFRAARLIPAVEYIQMNRVRTLVMQAMARLFDEIDVYIAPSFAGSNLLLTNLTGHPAVVVPNGFTDAGLPTTITFTGHLYDEATVLAVAHTYQQATDRQYGCRFHLMRPPATV